MSSSRQIRRLIAGCVVAVVGLSGCSRDSNDAVEAEGPKKTASVVSPTEGTDGATLISDENSTETVVDPPRSPTTTAGVSAPSTTVAWTRGAERTAWEQFLESYEVLDRSEFSRGPCGVYAMMLTEGSVTFYWWNGREWVDRSALLLGGQGDKPAKVYTRDFTLDGVADFFVEYEPSRDYRGQSYGAFFAYPWTEEQQCQWAWIDVDDGRDLTKRVISPEIDQRNSRVFGDGFEKGRWGTYGVYEFLGSSSSFVFRQYSRSQDK